MTLSAECVIQPVQMCTVTLKLQPKLIWQIKKKNAGTRPPLEDHGGIVSSFRKRIQAVSWDRKVQPRWSKLRHETHNPERSPHYTQTAEQKESSNSRGGGAEGRQHGETGFWLTLAFSSPLLFNKKHDGAEGNQTLLQHKHFSPHAPPEEGSALNMFYLTLNWVEQKKKKKARKC